MTSMVCQLFFSFLFFALIVVFDSGKVDLNMVNRYSTSTVSYLHMMTKVRNREIFTLVMFLLRYYSVFQLFLITFLPESFRL